MEQLEHDNLVRQNRAVKHMRTGFIEKDLDVSFSVIPVSRHSDLRSDKSTSSANLFVNKSSSIHPQTAHSMGGPPV